jgi:hypothetical protein
LDSGAALVEKNALRAGDPVFLLTPFEARALAEGKSHPRDIAVLIRDRAEQRSRWEEEHAPNLIVGDGQGKLELAPS